MKKQSKFNVSQALNHFKVVGLIRKVAEERFKLEEPKTFAQWKQKFLSEKIINK